MIVTVGTTYELVLTAAKTTNDMEWLLSYTESGTQDAGENSASGVSNGTTPVVLLAFITDGERMVNTFSLHNADTATKTAVIRYNLSGTMRIQVKAALLTLETLYYERGRGWYVLDADGKEKVQVGAGGGGAADGFNIISAGSQNAGTAATVVFSNSNGVSFGMSNSSIVTAQMDALRSVSAGTLDTNVTRLVFSNANGISFGLSGSTITGSHDGVIGGAERFNILSAGTQIAGSQATVVFADSNGVSFGMSGSSQITATVKTDYQSSGNYLTTAMLSNAATISNINISAGTTSNNLSAVVFSNANNVSFGMGGSTVTASIPNAVRSVSAGTSNIQSNQIIFVDGSGITWGANGASITGSVKTDYQTAGAYLTTAMLSNAATISNVKISAGTLSNLLSALTFSDSNGLSFGLSGSVITGTVKTDYQSSGAYLTTAMLSNAATISNIKVSAGTLSNNLSALTFSDSNGISFGLSGSVVTGTVKTDYQTSGAYLTTAMLSNAATISNIKISAGTSSANLSALTFSDSNGMSFGLNGSVMTADHAQLASYLENFPAGRIDGAAVVLGTLFFQRLAIPYKMNVTEADLVMLVSNSANAAGSHTMNLALYTISNTSKAVMASSTSRTFAYNSTLAASSYTHVSGTRYRSFDAPWAITPGDYLLAVGVSLSTGLTSGTYSVYGANIPQIRAEEFAGGDHLRYFGRGAFSAATNGIPASVHISDINQTGGANIGAMPWIQFIGT